MTDWKSSLPLDLKFVPWPLPRARNQQRDFTVDPETGIAPISEWGYECARGFVSDSRFQKGTEQVIKRTNRETTRKWLKLGR